MNPNRCHYPLITYLTDWTSLFSNSICFKYPLIYNFKMKKTLLKELLLQNQEEWRMEISKLRPFLGPKFEDVKRRWKQDYSKKYWVISLSQRERGKLIFTGHFFNWWVFSFRQLVFSNVKTWQIKTVNTDPVKKYVHTL